ncbi:MAG: hypothetical protein PHI93_10965 [Kiritimatiellae bacterium]|nr:hypothetical protein [Kiritimatiellia bacterium]
MNTIDPDISLAIITVLQECDGKPLSVRALTTYVNGYTRSPAAVPDVARHVANLETRGYIQRIANRFNPAQLQWAITESGKIL